MTPSAPPAEELNQNSDETIRRYFERLTLLETIYEKLNIESNKKPVESIDHHQQKLSIQENTTQSYHSPEKRIPMKEEITNRLPISSPNKSGKKFWKKRNHFVLEIDFLDVNKSLVNKFVEMNVDGNGSISSSKSSIKRRAPTAPHISQNNNHNPVSSNLL